MTWECPYQLTTPKDVRCNRLKKTCKPMQKGCVLDQWRRTALEEQRSQRDTPARRTRRNPNPGTPRGSTG